MTTVLHTETPWELTGEQIVENCYGKVIAHLDVGLEHPPKRYVGREEMHANGIHIVRCVNERDRLINALRIALGTLLGFTDATHETVKHLERILALATEEAAT